MSTNTSHPRVLSPRVLSPRVFSLRVLSPFLLASLATLPPTLSAQEKPALTVAAAMAGTWRFVPERSDSLPVPPAAIGPRPNPADAVGGAPTGGGGRRRGGGSTGASGASGSPAGLGTRRAGGGSQNPYVQELMSQLQPPGVMMLSISDTLVTISTPEGAEVSWVPDGRKQPQAQIDGTMLEFSGRWRGDKLQLTDGVIPLAELKRELRVIDNGTALEMKLELGGPGIPRKLSRRVVFERVTS